MGTRIQLHSVLLGILQSEFVYFQPPESIKMEYPCIRYKRDKIETRTANNSKYSHLIRYTITLIYKDPDSTLPMDILNLPMCRHDKHFTKDGLIHDVFELYY